MYKDKAEKMSWVNCDPRVVKFNIAGVRKIDIKL